VEAFAAGCLAKADETEGVEPFAHFAGSFDLRGGCLASEPATTL
jgi:hypothetical protein